MRALLQTRNKQPQTLAIGEVMNVGTPVRRYGQNIQLVGGNVKINGEGYYLIDVAVTFDAGATGDAVLEVMENGVVIADVSRSAVTDMDYTLSVPTTSRIRCCEEKIITVAISGIASTVTDVNMRVVKA